MEILNTWLTLAGRPALLWIVDNYYLFCILLPVPVVMLLTRIWDSRVELEDNMFLIIFLGVLVSFLAPLAMVALICFLPVLAVIGIAVVGASIAFLKAKERV